MINKEWKDFNHIIHPGEILSNYLDDLGISQNQLAEKLGFKKSFVNEIINGKRSITKRTAIKLESIFSMKASFWTNLQSIYDEALERNKIFEESLSSKSTSKISL
jgi:addiction module HigA family antidote